MAGSSFGTLFRVTTWGESHGAGIGAVLDGCPAGLALCPGDIQSWLDRRRPGQNRYTTARRESDQVEILSGVYEGRTLGTPISLLIRNQDARSQDYSDLASCYRPGHADFGFDQKYGLRDHRGGGRSSGRETAGRVAAGAVAAKLLSCLGISVAAWTSSIGPAVCSPERFDPRRILTSPLFMPDAQAEQEALSFLDTCIQEKTSCGGTAECLVSNLMPGLGEPVFDKLDAQLGKALFSIGAVKAVEIGDGVKASSALGHESNDAWQPGPDGNAAFLSNHAGGVLGGISTGAQLRVRVHFKPTPSISRPQQALRRDGSVHTLSIRGRHDPVIVPRAVVVVEAMTALTLADLLLRNMSASMQGVLHFYRR